MKGTSFYDAESPDEAMTLYLDSHDNLYDREKERITREILHREVCPEGLAGRQVLEIGAGGGIFTAYLLGLGARVTVVDTCEPILRKSREIHPRAEFHVADGTTIDLDRQFDLVFAKDVIEHIEPDDAFLRNMNRHLKLGGRLMVSTQNNVCLNYLVQGGYHYLRGNRAWYGWDPTHVRFYNYRSLKRKLADAEFRSRRWFGSYFVPYRLLADHFGRRFESPVFCVLEKLGLYDVMPFAVLAWNIGAVAEKVREIDVPNSSENLDHQAKYRG